MKILTAAFALAFAIPAAAQTPPAGQHQDHAQHQRQGSGAHDAHQGHQPGGQHDQHQGHDMGSGCCADRNGNGRMDCCEAMAAGGNCCHERDAQPAQRQPGQPQAHQNH